MKIKILCIGNIKEKFIADGILEYRKRIKAYSELEIIELKEEKVKGNLGEKDILNIKEKEGERLVSKIDDQDYVVLLDLGGKEMNSEEFSQVIFNFKMASMKSLVFIIGGSYGISSNVFSRKNLVISFSKMTFPHQLFRLILVEQIYRGFKILGNEKYHK